MRIGAPKLKPRAEQPNALNDFIAKFTRDADHLARRERDARDAQIAREEAKLSPRERWLLRKARRDKGK